jgi:hypothetical protein
MERRYIFTCTAGRSGQNTLAKLLSSHVPGCYAAFEEPKATPVLPRALGDLEKRFRRKFIETHELLGRGKVLTAYEKSDIDYIDSVAERRMRKIAKQLRRHDAHIYVDISKYFARGLHLGFARQVPAMGLILLVRDPLMNMRSFLNRNKDFYLDNSAPNAPNIILQLDPSSMEKGELFLWAWCEMYLRYSQLLENLNIKRAVEIRTEDLNDAGKMNQAFDLLGLEHTPVEVGIRLNSNKDSRAGITRVGKGDIRLFEQFVNRLPPSMLERIPYLRDYDPASMHTI